jgi:hypothetical protein
MLRIALLPVYHRVIIGMEVNKCLFAYIASFKSDGTSNLYNILNIVILCFFVKYLTLTITKALTLGSITKLV